MPGSNLSRGDELLQSALRRLSRRCWSATRAPLEIGVPRLSKGWAAGIRTGAIKRTQSASEFHCRKMQPGAAFSKALQGKENHQQNRPEQASRLPQLRRLAQVRDVQAVFRQAVFRCHLVCVRLGLSRCSHFVLAEHLRFLQNVCALRGLRRVPNTGLLQADTHQSKS